LKKKSILKMIRQHQEERYKNLFEEDKTTVKSKPDDSQFNKEFQEAKLFLENLSDKKEQSDKIKNYTLKQYPNPNSNSMLLRPALDTLSLVEPVVTSNNPPVIINPVASLPKYGCLKNGSLPTYRNYMNQTRKQLPNVMGGGTIINSLPSPSLAQTPSQSPSPFVSENKTTMPVIGASSIPVIGGANEAVEKRINDSLSRVKQMNQTALKLQQLKRNMRPKKMKQKKTKRRTYKVGKSSVLPKISVLVSNKTIRNNISTKKQLLKQVNIQEIKSYLMKRGFIKVGSTAPNDVLRKMYESAIMICGEIQNHNPENLLYNYMNGGVA